MYKSFRVNNFVLSSDIEELGAIPPTAGAKAHKTDVKIRRGQTTGRDVNNAWRDHLKHGSIGSLIQNKRRNETKQQNLKNQTGDANLVCVE